MNIFIHILYLVYIIKVSGDDVTTKIDHLTSNNFNEPQPTSKSNLNVDKKQTKASVGPSKFDMKDFKLTTLKDNYHDVDVEECLATANPDKVAAVRETLKSGRRLDEPANAEDIKIAACLKKENTQVTASTNATASKDTLDTIEEVAMKLEDSKKEGRRDTEYQFDPLEYYDEAVDFDGSTCPEDVDVIELEMSELKQYDVECELMTHWLGLTDTLQ